MSAELRGVEGIGKGVNHGKYHTRITGEAGGYSQNV